MLTLWLDSANIRGNWQNDELDIFCRIEKVDRNEVLRGVPFVQHVQKLRAFVKYNYRKRGFMKWKELSYMEVDMEQLSVMLKNYQR